MPEIRINIKISLIYWLFPYPDREIPGRTRQPTDNHPGNRPPFSGDPLLRKLQLAAFFLAQFHKSIFVAEQFVAGNIPFPAFCLPYPANILGLENGFQPVTTVFMISLIL